MATYSIDLGIDANATDGKSGTADSPYPLQIALTQGVLIPDVSTGPIYRLHADGSRVLLSDPEQ
jgi:hypothetical protein